MRVRERRRWRRGRSRRKWTTGNRIRIIGTIEVLIGSVLEEKR